jgi:hypothetical protein
MKRGEVVVVDVAFSDGTGSKVRPAVVVSADANNAAIDDLILAAISRSTRRKDRRAAPSLVYPVREPVYSRQVAGAEHPRRPYADDAEPGQYGSETYSGAGLVCIDQFRHLTKYLMGQ